MTPIELLDDFINTIQTLPLDTQHFIKLITMHDKIIIENTKKRDKITRRLLSNPKNETLYKRFKRYQLKIEKALAKKIKVASSMENIIEEIETQLKAKLVHIDEALETEIPEISNIQALSNYNEKVIIKSEDPIYCICGERSQGDMIACDNSECPVGWFHFACVGLMSAPKGKWFCDNCRKNKKYSRGS